jgi:uncharacterized circularly permuted ATP-grasp superfamily protein/uncharacterized alpha-E superfamily protein
VPSTPASDGSPDPARNAPASVPSILADYRPLAGVFDEMTENGRLRPHWKSFVEQLERIGSDELDRRWLRAQRQIDNDGVTFHPQGESGGVSRPWLLDAIPMVVTEREWDELGQGLAQRAGLLELIVRDLFGARRLLHEKLLPPEFLYAHPSFHPALHGLNPPERHYLQLYAADVARDPSGRWFVTGDRTRSPFGLGYALENRIVTSRMLPSAFRHCRVERLAKFYRRLRDTLRGLAPQAADNPRIVLWTRGPTSPSYFEDSYLARYLGYTLAEGGDLAVRENRVMLKTLGALLPVDVLFRRLDDDDCDPVELDPSSTGGLSGLVEVLREGTVATANALGSRLLESPMLMPFLPRIAKVLLGEELRTPAIESWWCGDGVSLPMIEARLDDLLLRPAFRPGDEGPIHPATLTSRQRKELLERIRRNPGQWVAQERIVRSTAPVRVDGRCLSWPLAIRAFLVAANDGYETMPGGLVRVSPDGESLDRTMTSGERSQDLWILAEGPVEEISLLAPAGQQLELRRSGAELPSRVADNLFWLGRNVERAEAICRLLRSVLSMLTGERDQSAESSYLLRAVAELGQLEPDYVVEGLRQQLPDVVEVLPEAVFDRRLSRSLRATIDEVVRLGGIVRDRVALDMWRIIHRLDETCRRPGDSRRIDPVEVLSMLDVMVTELVAFAGLAAESMTRTQGWRFHDLGRRIERSWQTAMLIRATLSTPHKDEAVTLEAVLRTVDSVMTYRTRYLATLQPAPVFDLLMTDETNPRSLRFQLDRIVQHVELLPRDGNAAVMADEQRLASDMQHAVRMADVFDLAKAEGGERVALVRLLNRLLERLPKLSDAVSGRFLIHAGLQRHFASGGAARRDAEESRDR